jgi:transcriptional regulator with AAA-type ATPase domain
MRNLAGHHPYPPEREPPRSCAQAIRLLDIVIRWCDRRQAAAARGDGDHGQESSSGPATLQQAQDVTTEDYRALLAIKRRIDPASKYIGESLPILRAFKQIDIFNRDPSKPVLILGPTGAGKTELAELIHTSSSRRDKRYCREQAANNTTNDFGFIQAHWVGLGKHPCLPNGPTGPRPGILRQYAGGTIFLDEVHAAAPIFQRFLHDVLDRRPISVTIGEATDFVPDVRMIFGTNVDPEKEVRDGAILHDFYRRIKTRVLVIPPLADRREDVPLFVQSRCKDYRVTPAVMLCLQTYTWPGNIGELLAVLDLAKDEAGGRGAEITLDHLSGREMADVVADVRELPEGAAEKHVFLTLWQMLERQGWRARGRGHALQTRLAELMGVSPATISRRASAYLGLSAGHALG